VPSNKSVIPHIIIRPILGGLRPSTYARGLRVSTHAVQQKLPRFHVSYRGQYVEELYRSLHKIH
jgi:hypothetical protein